MSAATPDQKGLRMTPTIIAIDTPMRPEVA
jgi:hypothetical protein